MQGSASQSPDKLDRASHLAGASAVVPIPLDGEQRRGESTQSSHGWLGAVLPVEATSFRVGHTGLENVLRRSGGEIVDTDPDVEIASTVEDIQGDASVAVVVIDPPLRLGGQIFVRAGRRVAQSGATHARARHVRRALRRRGYDHCEIVFWDLGHRLATDGVANGKRRVAERLPGRALVVGRRQGTGRTVLEAALADASAQAGIAPQRLSWVSVRSGILVGASDEAVIRVAVGPGRVQLVNQVAALEALNAAQPPSYVAERIPWPLARGRTGVADWSLERFLPGANPSKTLSSRIVDDCVDFLTVLHRVRGESTTRTSLARLAEVVATACQPEAARRLEALTNRLEQELADVPRGFGHGDFFRGNLLVLDGRLTGVLDWDAGGPGRLPLVDLLHLQLTRSGYGSDNDWGPAILSWLLPHVASDADTEISRYCEDIGLDADPGLVATLTLAYWLGYAAYQLGTHPTRHSQPLWVERNIEHVLREIDPVSGRL